MAKLDWEKNRANRLARGSRAAKRRYSSQKMMTDKQRDYLTLLLRQKGIQWEPHWDNSFSRAKASYLIKEIQATR